MNSSQLEAAMQDISKQVWTLAKEHQEDNLALLSLLRALENVHREIREEFFQNSLPASRRELENLLRDIEEKGGWPYIERMRLKALLDHFNGMDHPNQ